MAKKVIFSFQGTHYSLPSEAVDNANVIKLPNGKHIYVHAWQKDSNGNMMATRWGYSEEPSEFFPTTVYEAETVPLP